MEKAERKRLKALGKKMVEESSARVASLLSEATPAPVGTEAWAQQYRRGVERENAARKIHDRIVSAKEAAESYVLNFKTDDFSSGYPAVPGWFYHCGTCGDLLPSAPSVSLGCRCGNIFIDIDGGRLANREGSSITLVSLIGKA